MYDKDIIKDSLTEQDIIKICTTLGSNPPKYDNQGNLIFNTICHNIVGGSYKLYYYKNSKVFHCYTECQDNFDIYELVIRTMRLRGRELSFYESVQYVADLTGKRYTSRGINKSQNYLIDDWEWINKYKPINKPKIELPKYSKNVLECFDYIPHELWLNEGISEKTMRKFQIGYYHTEKRITIPHFDIDGNLIGIRGRTIVPEVAEEGKKYMPIKIGKTLYNHPTAFSLYGLYQNQNAIKRTKKIVIFEAEKSVLKCEDFYEDNNFSVAVLGSNVHNIQRDIILNLGVKEVFIAFDKEFEKINTEEEYKYAEKILKIAYKFAPYVTTYILWDEEGLLDYKDAPVDKGKEVFEYLMKKKIEVNTKII